MDVPLHLQCHFTRRTIVRLMAAGGLLTRSDSLSVPARAQTVAAAYSYPMGFPGRPLGDGLLVRHGYATENTWYLPGYLHAGEDWYTTEGDAAGAGVYAAATGEVIFAGSDYPGRVVIVRHAADLFSMYGHLDYALAVGVGDVVECGQPLGTVLARTDGRAPSHLHFEVRTFLTAPEVNGSSPRYGFACGVDCPPGPGYWPIDAPEHPSVMGWRNPTHVIGSHTELFEDSEAIVATTAAGEVEVWSAPQRDDGAQPVRTLLLRPGDRYALLAIDAGPAASEGTSAEAYRLWYQIATTDGTEGWVQAAVPSTRDTGSDGRPSSVQFDFLPAVTAE
jgi:murein DD-endopeptidase MepM/ murein hydrolase activator NlpD